MEAVHPHVREIDTGTRILKRGIMKAVPFQERERDCESSSHPRVHVREIHTGTRIPKRGIMKAVHIHAREINTGTRILKRGMITNESSFIPG